MRLCRNVKFKLRQIWTFSRPCKVSFRKVRSWIQADRQWSRNRLTFVVYSCVIKRRHLKVICEWPVSVEWSQSRFKAKRGRNRPPFSSFNFSFLPPYFTYFVPNLFICGFICSPTPIWSQKSDYSSWKPIPKHSFGNPLKFLVRELACTTRNCITCRMLHLHVPWTSSWEPDGGGGLRR